MHKYRVKFRLINEEKSKYVDLTEDKYRKVIDKSVKQFNASGKVARNFKEVYQTRITSNGIELWMSSKDRLENPTKSFKFFSKALVENPLFAELRVGKQLLKGLEGTELFDETDNQEEVINTMSDEEMITTLVHWIMGKEVEDIEIKKNKKRVISKIKELILEVK